MPITLLDLWRQKTLALPSSCDLNCLGCHIKKNTPISTSSLPEEQLASIRSASLINIVGGDPCQHPQCIILLQDFHKRNIKTRLWTHAHHPSEFLQKTAPFVSEFCLFLPHSEPDQYRLLTSQNDFNQLERTVSLLKEIDSEFMFHTPVTNNNIEWLPDLREFAYKHQTSLYLQIRKPNLFSKDERQHINYYKKLPNCFVYTQSTLTLDHICPAVGATNPPSALSMLENKIRKWIK